MRVQKLRIILATALFALTAMALLLLRHWNQVEVIPQPWVRPINAYTTLQWEPQTVASREFERPPESHPGFALAQTHCTRCHLLPSPDQVPRETWPFVLTWMSNYLGYTNLYTPFANNVEGSLMPPHPLLTESEFQAVAKYYLLFSASEEDGPTDTRRERRASALDRFEPWTPPWDIAVEEPITLLHFDDANRRYYIGRASIKALQVFDQEGRILLSKAAGSEPVDVEILPRGFRLTVLGDFLRDQMKGEVIDVTITDDGRIESVPLIQDYHRLTQSVSVDLNQDAAPDLLLVGFGAGVTGKVSVFWRDTAGAILGETTLIDYAGALNARVRDWDGDDLKDVMLLTAQAHQELILFRNRGRGAFERHELIRQFAGYGYNHLGTADFNRDGRMDLILVNGNNMEIKNAPLKAYHGIRILENRGELPFEEISFYPMHGALKAVAEDFDGDGDLDMAAISLYPDWSLEDPETFVYLECLSPGRFKPHTLPEPHWGRWMTLDTGDVDGDGDIDVLLGGGYVPHGVPSNHTEAYRQKTRGKPSVLILKNKSRPGDRSLP